MCSLVYSVTNKRDSKLIICSSPFFTTEDLCHQCDIYYYYYYESFQFRLIYESMYSSGVVTNHFNSNSVENHLSSDNSHVSFQFRFSRSHVYFVSLVFAYCSTYLIYLACSTISQFIPLYYFHPCLNISYFALMKRGALSLS